MRTEREMELAVAAGKAGHRIRGLSTGVGRAGRILEDESLIRAAEAMDEIADALREVVKRTPSASPSVEGEREPEDTWARDAARLLHEIQSQDPHVSWRDDSWDADHVGIPLERALQEYAEIRGLRAAPVAEREPDAMCHATHWRRHLDEWSGELVVRPYDPERCRGEGPPWPVWIRSPPSGEAAGA